MSRIGDMDVIFGEAAPERKPSVLSAVCAKSSPVLVGTVFSLRHCMLSAAESSKADEASTSASASASVRSSSCPRDVDDDQELVDDVRPSQLFLEALRRVSGSRDASRVTTLAPPAGFPAEASPVPPAVPPAATVSAQVAYTPRPPTLPRGPPPSSQRPRSAMASFGGAGPKRLVTTAPKASPPGMGRRCADEDTCEDLLLERAHFLRAVQFVKQQLVASNVTGVDVEAVAESVPRFSLPTRPRSAVARLGGGSGGPMRGQESRPSLSIPPQISEDEEEDGEVEADI